MTAVKGELDETKDVGNELLLNTWPELSEPSQSEQFWNI